MRPLVVMVGRGLDGMEQVAASIRRRGAAVGWVGMPYGPHLRARARLFCDQVDSAYDAATLATVLRGWGLPRIVDIVTNELSMPEVATAVDRLSSEGLPAQVVADVERRSALTDKFTMRARLAAAGVLVPAAYDARTTPAATAARELGLPLMVKGHHGYAGSSVRLARTVAEAQRYADGLLAGDEVYYEQRVAGEECSVVLSYRPEGLVQVGSYRSHKSPRDPLGFATAVDPLDRPALEKVGRQVAEAVGGRGLLNLNALTDRDGDVWVIDVNLRPWHTVVALRATGTDFAAGYLYALGLGPPPGEPTRLPAGGQVTGFPREGAELIRRHPVRGARMLARQAHAYRDWTGSGYLVAAGFRAGMTLAARVYREAMDSGHPATRVLPRLGEYRDPDTLRR